MMCWLLLVYPTPEIACWKRTLLKHIGDDKVALASWQCGIGDVELVTWQCELDDVNLATSPSGLGQLVK
jgi:hypothetical protein